jgi:hypothetical protein
LLHCVAAAVLEGFGFERDDLPMTSPSTTTAKTTNTTNTPTSSTLLSERPDTSLQWGSNIASTIGTRNNGSQVLPGNESMA